MSLRRRASWGAALALAAAAGPALADPMRPLGASAPAPGAAATVALPRGASPAEAGPALKGRLVAIRTDDGGRRRALIGDEWSAPGDRVGPWRVAEVGPHHVELRAGSHRQVLHLLQPLQPTPQAGALALGGRLP